jgi:PAS domain S-box-containing protein
MISMCSYCLDSCTPQDIVDVTFRHNVVVARQSNRWSCAASADNKVQITSGERELRRVLEALPAAVYTTDADGYLTYFNEAAAELWGYRPEIGKQRWCGTFKIALFDGTVVPHDQCPMAVAVKTGQPVYGIEAYAERPDGTRIPCAPFPTPMFDEDGKVIGGINMLVDISQQKATLERQSILVRELDHRIKNNLATIQAIAGSTIRNSRSMEEFQDAFIGRIGALSRTHSLLTELSQSHVSLRQLLNNELDPYADGDGQRIVLSGTDVSLAPHMAVPVGMGIHELTTNALKYGALSVLGGSLMVTWRSDQSFLHVEWQEKGVQISEQPTRIGFGTQLLQRLFPAQLKAEVTMEFGLDGLKAMMKIPVS